MADEAQELTAQPKTLNLPAPKKIDVLRASLGRTPGIGYGRMAKEVKTPEQAAGVEGQIYQQIEPMRARLAEMEAEKASIEAAGKALIDEQEVARARETEIGRAHV